MQNEMTGNKGSREVSVAALIVLSVSGSIVMLLFPLVMLLLPGLWAYTILKIKRPTVAVILTGIAAMATGFFYGVFIGCCISAILLFVSLSIYIGEKTKKIGNFWTVMIASGFALLFLYCSICLPGILGGRGAYADAEIYMQQYIEALRSGITAIGEGPIPKNILDSYFSILENAVSVMLIPCLCAAAEAIGFFNVLFFRLLCRKQDCGICPIRAFSGWRIPRNLTGGICAFLMGGFILEMTQWDYAAAFSNTVDILIGLPLTMQGLCFIDFMILRKGINIKKRRVIVYLLCGIFFALLQTPLMLLGSFDQFFKVRERMDNLANGKGQQPAGKL